MSVSKHGSKELDEDAAKLEALGADPGPTLEDVFFPPVSGYIEPGRTGRFNTNPLIPQIQNVSPDASREAKISITIRIDADVLRWFKLDGAGWQTRINDVLKVHYENSFIHHPIRRK